MKVIIFGFGEMGKTLIDECIDYGENIELLAIVDNNSEHKYYRNLKIIYPSEIVKYEYDEIWVATVYYHEILQQLIENYGIDKEIIHFTEPVVPILEERLRKKYSCEISNPEKVQNDKRELFTYLKNHKLRMYCYNFYDAYFDKNTLIARDEKNGLYYGMYQGKKMYLARHFDTEQKARAYFNAVTMEQDDRSPHCYWSDTNLRNATGIGIDIGAAEGIFALSIIEQIDKIYLIEADKRWIEALRYTFEPYKDKAIIIEKCIGSENSEKMASIDVLFSGEKIDFIKLDIEGMELEALQGAERTLSDNNIELAVCVYHHREDEEVIGNWLVERGYHITNSKGYVICQGEWELKNADVDFRHALIYASKEEK